MPDAHSQCLSLFQDTSTLLQFFCSVIEKLYSLSGNLTEQVNVWNGTNFLSVTVIVQLIS